MASAAGEMPAIPGGEALAKRTFNPRLGVEGGLSVIGTCESPITGAKGNVEFLLAGRLP